MKWCLKLFIFVTYFGAKLKDIDYIVHHVKETEWPIEFEISGKGVLHKLGLLIICILHHSGLPSVIDSHLVAQLVDEIQCADGLFLCSRPR